MGAYFDLNESDDDEQTDETTSDKRRSRSAAKNNSSSNNSSSKNKTTQQYLQYVRVGGASVNFNALNYATVLVNVRALFSCCYCGACMYHYATLSTTPCCI
jgi:hypothetical protein